ncbi:MAG: adenylate/guanylate cyclase domain-containing protein [Gemmatimonadaceae bacterium]
MDERPVTRYATAPDGVRIAYQVIGEGAVDLVFPPAITIPIDLYWDEPGLARFWNRLSRFSRTVICDHRGMGASGGSFEDHLVEEITDADLTAVLDSARSERSVLAGIDVAGATAIRYAAVHPKRISGLILGDTYAHYVRDDDYPVGYSPDAFKRFAASLTESFGTGVAVDILAPSKAGDKTFRAWWARCERLGVGVDAVVETTWASFVRDVRPLLPTLAVPTLVLHRAGNHWIRVEAGRYLAQHIIKAKYVEVPGDDHMLWIDDTDTILDEIQEFVTGRRSTPEGDVVSTTILFTDIVASTEQSARLGHRKWTALTDSHDTMVRSVLARYRGREVKTLGDGFLATFDATTRAVRAATEIVAQAKNIGIDLRGGVHTGEVEVRPDDIVGLAVTIAKRICDLAHPGEVLVSEAVKLHLIGSGIATSEHGTEVLKGVPEEWRLYAIDA